MPSLYGIGLTCILKQFESHSHPEWEFAYYFEGCGDITVDNRVIHFSPGTLVCVPPNSIHSEHSIDGYRNYHFGVLDFTLGDSDNVFIDNDAFDLKQLLDMLYRSAHSQQERNTALTNSILDAFLNTMLAYSDIKNKHVEKMIQSIIHNISNPQYKIIEAYEGIPMSSDHLRRLFITQTGMTPTDYLLKKRISQAEKLLYTTIHPSIKQVAFLCGFSDQYYFSRAFKKRNGVSPISYSLENI